MFYDLSSQRSINGYVVSRIPYSEIVAFLQLHQVFDEEQFLYHIRKMDEVYVEIASKKVKEQLDKIKRKAKKR